MKVYFGKITGVEEAINSLMMSKRTWTPDIAAEIRRVVSLCTDEKGAILSLDALEDLNPADVEKFGHYVDILIKYGVKHGHATLLRFIDVSFIVEGLHRGAQDDFDSHAKRLDNRIVRSSTRLARYEAGEVSDWYKNKIITTEQAIEAIGVDIPDKIFTPDGTKFVKVPGGFIREDLKEDNDVRRGLYNLSIPSNFIFKVQYPELCHIMQVRDSSGHAHPELQEMMEQIREILLDKFYELGANLNKLQMEPGSPE